MPLIGKEVGKMPMFFFFILMMIASIIAFFIVISSGDQGRIGEHNVSREIAQLIDEKSIRLMKGEDVSELNRKISELQQARQAESR